MFVVNTPKHNSDKPRRGGMAEMSEAMPLRRSLNKSLRAWGYKRVAPTELRGDNSSIPLSPFNVGRWSWTFAFSVPFPLPSPLSLSLPSGARQATLFAWKVGTFRFPGRNSRGRAVSDF